MFSLLRMPNHHDRRSTDSLRDPRATLSAMGGEECIQFLRDIRGGRKCNMESGTSRSKCSAGMADSAWPNTSAFRPKADNIDDCVPYMQYGLRCAFVSWGRCRR